MWLNKWSTDTSIDGMTKTMSHKDIGKIVLHKDYDHNTGVLDLIYSPDKPEPEDKSPTKKSLTKRVSI